MDTIAVHLHVSELAFNLGLTCTVAVVQKKPRTGSRHFSQLALRPGIGFVIFVNLAALAVRTKYGNQNQRFLFKRQHLNNGRSLASKRGNQQT